MEKDKIVNRADIEIEILEFQAGGNSYGVNVSDIREIIPYNKKSTIVPNAHPYIEGIIKPRDFLITIIDFVKSLKLNDVEDLKNEMLIVTEINELNIAFHVDSVKGIHRIMTSEIAKPGKKLTTSVKGVVVGTFTRENRKIELVELRKIILEINPQVKVDKDETKL